MSDSLATYIHDHLAGANFAIDLLDAMKERHKGEPLGTFAGAVLVEVREDRDTLKRLADEIGSGSNVLKEVGAWLGEKASRAKLGSGATGDLAVFQALEFLALGIQGKLSLWRALQVTAVLDARLRGLDLQQLIARAEAQHAKVEERRLASAATALSAVE